MTALGCAVAPAGVFLRGVWIDSTKRSISLYVSVHVEYTATEPLNAKTLAQQLGHGQAAYAGYQTFVRVDLHEVHRNGVHYTTLPEQEYAAVKRDIHWV